MSRIGKQPISIPQGVRVDIQNGLVQVTGPKGALSHLLTPEIRAEVAENALVFKPARATKRTAALWGLERALMANIVKGVTEGYEKKLEIEGVGYRAQAASDKELVLTLGYSHPVNMKAPDGIVFKVEKNVITISGIDKSLVGQVAADIRAKRPPEPYKGKGIHYLGEVIRRKAGKKATASAK